MNKGSDIMGLFDKVSDNLNKKAENQLKKRDEKKLKKQEEKEAKILQKEKAKQFKEQQNQRINDEKDSIFDFKYGIKCNVQMPPREVISSHGGLTKGVATMGFGLAGMAATSGSKTKLKSELKRNILVAVRDQGLIFHNAAHDRSNVNVSWNDITKCHYMGNNRIKPFGDIGIILVNGHNINITTNTRHNKKDAAKQLYEIIESNMCGGDENVWGNNSEESSTTSNAEELLKWHDLFEKGVISEEEFEQNKKELL